MVKRIVLLTVFCITVIGASGTGMCAGEKFGLGFIFGEPLGISGKLWKSKSIAFDGAAAWSFADESNLHIHADILHHNWNLLTEGLTIKEGDLPLYYGIGGRIKIENETRVGVRLVLGIAYIFEPMPLDVFFEIAPIMDVVPKTEMNGNASVGVRFWFQ